MLDGIHVTEEIFKFQQIEKLKSHQLFIGITDWNLVCTVPINLTVYVQTITTNSSKLKL